MNDARYRIVTRPSMADLIKTVNYEIELGWTPLGSPFIDQYDNWHQALFWS